MADINNTTIPNVGNTNVNTLNVQPWNPVKPGAGINSFIPAVWNAAILLSFYEKALTPYITCTPDDIEGGMIIFNMLEDVQVTDYKDGTDIDYDGLNTNPITIPFDKPKSWAFKVTDIQKRQTKNGSYVGKAIVNAGRQLQKNIDTSVLAAQIKSAKKSGVNLGTINVSAENIYDILVNIDIEMSKMDMPEDGRYCVINHDMMGMLRKDPRFTFQPQVLREGIMEGSKVANMTIYTTNYLPSTIASGNTNATVQIMAGHPSCWGFGAELDESEELRSQGQFATLYRGLYLYGDGALRAKNFVTANCSLNTSIEPNIAFEETDN